MNDDLGLNKATIFDSLTLSRDEIEEVAQHCVDIIEGMHDRLERIERWIQSQEKEL
jgi:hypothetical protein